MNRDLWSDRLYDLVAADRNGKYDGLTMHQHVENLLDRIEELEKDAQSDTPEVPTTGGDS